jgi:hypothetical protein
VSNILAVCHDSAVAVTQSDSTDDPAGSFSALGCQVAGLAKITTVKGSVVTVSLVAGQLLHIATKRVWSSVTTATGIYGCHAMPWKGNGA